MALNVSFQGIEIRLPSWSGAGIICKRCGVKGYANCGGPIPTKTDRWQDGYICWSIHACFRCGHGEQHNKYVRAQYLKRVGRFDLKKDL